MIYMYFAISYTLDLRRKNYHSIYNEEGKSL